MFLFIGATIYHFIIRKRCIYPVKLTKPKTVLLIIIPIIFLGIAYYVENSSWDKYLLAISGSLFLISGELAQGISKEGIYYRPNGGGNTIMRLAKWEDIKDVKIDISKNKLESFKVKTRTILPDQYYDAKYINEISEEVKRKTK